MPSTIPVTAQVQGHTITCQKRDLEAEDDDAGLAWFDFESENSIASATGVDSGPAYSEGSQLRAAQTRRRKRVFTRGALCARMSTLPRRPDKQWMHILQRRHSHLGRQLLLRGPSQ